MSRKDWSAAGSLLLVSKVLSSGDESEVGICMSIGWGDVEERGML